MLAYFSFYRNLFARLRSPEQFATIQLLSSLWTVLFYPIAMSSPIRATLTYLFGYDRTQEEHVEDMAESLFIRNLAENVTMVSFLGWLTFLHFGPNLKVFPYFELKPTPDDPYNYRLTV